MTLCLGGRVGSFSYGVLWGGFCWVVWGNGGSCSVLYTFIFSTLKWLSDAQAQRKDLTNRKAKEFSDVKSPPFLVLLSPVYDIFRRGEKILHQVYSGQTVYIFVFFVWEVKKYCIRHLYFQICIFVFLCFFVFCEYCIMRIGGQTVPPTPNILFRLHYHSLSLSGTHYISPNCKMYFSKQVINVFDPADRETFIPPSIITQFRSSIHFMHLFPQRRTACYCPGQNRVLEEV